MCSRNRTGNRMIWKLRLVLIIIVAECCMLSTTYIVLNIPNIMCNSVAIKLRTTKDLGAPLPINGMVLFTILDIICLAILIRYLSSGIKKDEPKKEG